MTTVSSRTGSLVFDWRERLGRTRNVDELTGEVGEGNGDGRVTRDKPFLKESERLHL